MRRGSRRQMPGGRPTIHDVARLAGVSAKTVSRQLNSEPGVAAPTAERIRAAIAELGFRRNDAARLLRTGSPELTIGAVVPGFASPGWSGLAQAVEAAKRPDYLMLAASSQNDPDRERQVLRHLLGRGVGGLLIVPVGDDHRYLQADLEQGRAMVFVGRPAAQLAADSVQPDHLGSARKATEQLLRHWHRRIALVGEAAHVHGAAERVEGYRQALAAQGIGVDPELVRSVGSAAEAETAARELLSGADPPTAIVAAASGLAEAVGRAIAGSATALVAFDGPEIPAALGTRLTVVGHDPDEVWRQAVALLFERLDGGRSPVRNIVVPGALTTRGSGESRPALAGRRPATRPWFRR